MNYTSDSPFHTDQNLKSTRSYDFAVSLGTACIVASKMENNNLRLFSGPFDWIVGSPDRVHYLIKNNSKDFFLYDQSCAGAPRCKQRGMFAPPLQIPLKETITLNNLV